MKCTEREPRWRPDRDVGDVVFGLGSFARWWRAQCEERWLCDLDEQACGSLAPEHKADIVAASERLSKRTRGARVAPDEEMLARLAVVRAERAASAKEPS